VGGIGFAMVSPAIAESVASPPPAYEVVIENESGQSSESEGKGDIMPQDVDDVSQYNTKSTSCAYTLGDEFWKGIALLKGSTEAMLKSVLDKDPASVPALQCLAKRLIDIEDSSHALLVIEKLEALQPETIEWKYMKAEAYDCDGQFESAKQVFEDILKIEPFSSRALQVFFSLINDVWLFLVV
jgi:tetratricopeptide (TPR) repeat protein